MHYVTAQDKTGDDLDLNELKMVTFQPFTKNEVE